MRVLLLTRYERLGSSSRLRALQYLPYLCSVGIEVATCPLFTNDYLCNLYQRGERNYGRVAWSYIRRAFNVLRAPKYDLVWLESELFPWLPAWAEKLLVRAGLQYIVDYDDAVFHKYDCCPSALVRASLGSKIDTIMRHAAAVVAGNEYLAERARQAGAMRVEVVPTVVDLSHYPLLDSIRHDDRFTIGWIGSPPTTRYLKAIAPILSRFCKDHRARLVCLGAEQLQMPGVPVEVKEWSEETEATELCRFDVGIMPLSDGPWERGKCAFKVIQYMACGLPVVASPVGFGGKLIRHGQTGFLPSTAREWLSALTALYESKTLRKRMGRAGRRLIEDGYTVEQTAPRLAGLLRETVSSKLSGTTSSTQHPGYASPGASRSVMTLLRQ
jgi:glycosyltransferase involved in cell wall biosynthesis